MSNKKLTAAERFAKLGERLQEDGRLQIDEAKFELSEQIFQAMENRGVTEAELSRRLGVSRAYINKVLQGSANLTIESLVKLSRALDCDFKFRFVGKTKEAEIVEKGEEVDIIDAEIIYIKHKPISQNETVPQNLHHGYKPNGFYNFEDYKYKKVTDISLAEVQF